METKTELVPRHHSAHSDTLVPPSHPSSHTGHSSAHVKQAFFRICFKVPVYSPGVVPKHHAPYNTPFIRSFFAFFLTFAFFFLIYKSSSVLHTWFCPFLFLFKNQSVRLYPGAHGGTGYGAKWHALAGTHSPHFLQGQVNQEAGQDTTYPQREAAARSKVPLHVQGQVVRPGETPGGRNSERKGEKQGQAGATKAIKCDQR